MLSSILDYQHKYQNTICNLNLSLTSGVPITFFNIQKCGVIKKRQNIWKVSKENSVFLYVFISTSVFYQWESYSARIEILIWNLSIQQQKKVFLLFIQTHKEQLVMQAYEDQRMQRSSYPLDMNTLRHSEDVRLMPCDCKVMKRSVKSPKIFIHCV